MARSGVVTDSETGTPVAGARVGLIVYSPYSIFPLSVEKARSDAGGKYQFLNSESNSVIYVRSTGYLYQVESLSNAPRVTRDFQMQSLAGLLGKWEMTIDPGERFLGATQFVFTEYGVQWTSDSGFLGEVRFDFEGKHVVIDDLLIVEGDIVLGEMAAILELDKPEDTLTGEITFSHYLLEDFGCEPGCTGALSAVRIDD